MEKEVFKQIEIMPEDYEILNCPNCFKVHDRINQNHFILCGNSKRKEIYFVCITCGKIFTTKLKTSEKRKNTK